jgi:hypothetical protein
MFFSFFPILVSFQLKLFLIDKLIKRVTITSQFTTYVIQKYMIRKISVNIYQDEGLVPCRKRMH